MTSDEKKLLAALKEIQNLCAGFYKGKSAGETVQDIWRTANFAVIDTKKKKR